MKPANSAIHSPANLGFSLIEMAMVLMIMGILMSGIMVAVSQTTENARRTAALAQLRQIEDALYGFAQSNGRLPCPAIPPQSDPLKGQESPSGGGGATGSCNGLHGFVPAATLGFSGATNDDGLLLDPWRNPYRYSLASTATPNYDLYSDGTTESIRFFFSNSTVSNTNMFTVLSEATDCNTGTTQTDIAPAVVFTMGANWATTNSTLEPCNQGTGTVTGTSGTTYSIKANSDFEFVTADYSEDNFDDQLVWLSPYVLFNKMVSAGKLP